MNRPLIGLNTDVEENEKGITLFIRSRYVKAVQDAGGLPVLLPSLDAEDAAACLAALDGLVLSGGDDLSPSLYGGGERHPEEVPLHPLREAFDMALIREAIHRGIPTLAICLGAQELCVAQGGDIHPFIPDDVQGALQHRKMEDNETTHLLEIEAGSLLSRLLPPNPRVNSAHRQAIRNPGRGLKVSARTKDGIIEAVEGEGSPFLLGVQWHPELMADDLNQVRLFEGLIEAARSFKSGTC